MQHGVIVERVDEFTGFQCLRTAWDDLYTRDPEAQYFLSWKWLAGVLRANPGQWFVLVARDEHGRYLGLLPLRRKTVWSKSRERLRNELEFAGRLFWADYGGALCLPDCDEAVLCAFASCLKQMRWSHLSMKGFHISDRRYDILMNALSDERLTVESRTSIINGGETDNLVSPYVDLPDTFEAYLTERLSSNTRQKVRRFLRKLEWSPDYRITMTTAETQTRDLQILEALWRTMWASAKGSDTDRLAAKYRRIVEIGLNESDAHMTLLWYRDTPVGVLASFVDWIKSRLLFFVTGREDTFQDLPVGLVLHASNIRWAIEHGIRTYDFLRGDEPYKRSLGATAEVELRYPVIRTRSGMNLNATLDPGCLAEALHIVDDFVGRNNAESAMTGLYQVLSTVAGSDRALRLLDSLSEIDDEDQSSRSAL